MKEIRNSVFETNSSSTHSYTIHIGSGYYEEKIHCYSGESHDDVYLEDGDIDEILDYLPIERLEEAIKWKKEKLERDKKLEELNKEEDRVWREIHENCQDCVGNGCDDCRGCETKKINDELRRQLENIENEKLKL